MRRQSHLNVHELTKAAGSLRQDTEWRRSCPRHGNRNRTDGFCVERNRQNELEVPTRYFPQGRIPLLSVLVGVILLFCPSKAHGFQAAGQTAPGQTPFLKSASGTLVLVRAWNPRDGELVAWMPIHRAAITLQLIAGKPPELNLNEAETMAWLPRPDSPSRGGDMRISPAPRLFEGERWLPLKTSANVVRIHKCLFLVRAIEFGQSEWRRPARAR